METTGKAWGTRQQLKVASFPAFAKKLQSRTVSERCIFSSHVKKSIVLTLGTQKSTRLSQNQLTDAIKFIFSWVILLAIGVIVSGKLLAQRFPFKTHGKQLFRIQIKGVLFLEATGGEVVLGFTFYIICVALLGICFGSALQPWVKSHFGVDPGQFNALGFVSSLAAVTVSSIVFLFSRLPSPATGRDLVRRHDQIVEEITARILSRENRPENEDTDE